MDDRPRDALSAMPGIVRLVGRFSGRTIFWGVRKGLDVGDAALRLILTEEGTRRLTEELREMIRGATGVTDLEARVAPPSVNGADPVAVLKERGAELLARSADLEDEAHPAYASILSELAPDEARILRLLAIEGAQAVVDVHSWRPLSGTAELIATALTMIGIDANLHHPNRVPAYLSNLSRLGLATLSDEPVEGVGYHKLEGQPAVKDALQRAGRGRVTRRSIRMTAFGKAFADVCLPIDTAGFLAIQDDIRDRR